MITQIYLIKGKRLRPINHEKALELMHRYQVVESFYNQGRVLMLRSRNGSRIHSLVIVSE